MKIPQYKKFEMKLPGCEIPGTAARTLAPLTNFPRASLSFLLAGFTGGHSKNWETVKLRQHSISVRPMREKLTSLKHMKLHVDTEAAEHPTTDSHYETR